MLIFFSMMDTIMIKNQKVIVSLSIKNIYYKRPTSINDNYKHDLSTYMMASN